jgi:hypothetical protein
VNKYDKLMREIVDYLDGTIFSQPYSSAVDRGPIQGSSDAEIEQAEDRIDRKLPAAVKAWYRVAGKVPPYLNDHDADFSLRDLVESQTLYGHAQGSTWRQPKTVLIFSSRLGDQFLMVDTGIGDPDDPPVFRLGDENTSYRIVEPAYSVFMREMWLQWLEYCELDPRENTFKSQQYSIHAIRQEAEHLRQYLIEDVYQEDIDRDEITGPQAFQTRWIAEFSASDTWQKFQVEGLRFPYNWEIPRRTMRKSL